MGVIISAFPGMGKTYNTTKKDFGLEYSDSDSSQFKWVENVEGRSVNPHFPENYHKHIIEELKTKDIVFVSTHQEVRDMLADDFKIIVYPDRSLKEQMLQKYRDRRSGLHDEKFVNMMSEKWDEFIDSIEKVNHLENAIKVCYSNIDSPMELFQLFTYISNTGFLESCLRFMYNRDCHRQLIEYTARDYHPIKSIELICADVGSKATNHQEQNALYDAEVGKIVDFSHAITDLRVKISKFVDRCF